MPAAVTVCVADDDRELDAMAAAIIGDSSRPVRDRR
jgi:hypothetical protein